MAVPVFIWIAIAVATGALGVGETAKAEHDKHEANEVNESAQDIIQRAKDDANAARGKCGQAIQRLGETKVDVLDNSMKKFIASFEKIHKVELGETYGMDELRRFRIDKQSFSELKEIQSSVSSIAAGIGSGAAAGALTAFGAYSLAGAFATASTGPAIASLSGAAATNATLAFFGGGSIAAGGAGIAGGIAVLGGLVVGPALAVLGFVVGAGASKALDEARSNLSKAKAFEEDMKTAVALSNGIRRRANMMERLLLKLQCVFDPLVYAVEDIVENAGTDFSKYTDGQKETIAASMSVAGAIKAVLDTPLLTEDGKLTPESASISAQIQPVLPVKTIIFEEEGSADGYTPATARNDDLPFLMPVEDVFTITGRGTCAFGRVERGVLRSFDEVEIIGLTGERRKTAATAIMDDTSRKLVDYARTGDKISVMLRGIQRDEVKLGQVLAKPGSIRPHTKFQCQVYVLTKDEGGRRNPFFNNYRPQFRFRTTDVTGVITLPKGMDLAMPGCTVVMNVELITPVAIEEGLHFTVLELGRTVGSGVVTAINS